MFIIIPIDFGLCASVSAINSDGIEKRKGYAAMCRTRASRNAVLNELLYMYILLCCTQHTSSLELKMI